MISGNRAPRALLWAALLLALLTTHPAAAATCPRTTLPAIENDVMCVVCGTPLGHAGGPQADRQRAFIREQIAACRDERQIKAALVTEYGEAVLAVPRGRGFQLAAYVAPIVAALAAAALIGARLRRRGDGGSKTAELAAEVAAANGASARPAEAAALEADLRRYDL